MDEDRLQFRAWNSGKMIYFDKGYVGFMTTDEDTTKAGLFFPMMNKKFYMGSMLVMQYTGSKDKHGTRVFDGDILQRGMEYIGVVKWDDDGWVVSIPEHLQIDMFTGFKLNSFLQEETVIIGNIHENPELLTERVA